VSATKLLHSKARGAAGFLRSCVESGHAMDAPDSGSEPYVAVQHCLLVKQGMPDKSWQAGAFVAYVLHGVSYRHRVPTSATFPAALAPPWSVFLRLTGWNAGPTRVLFRVHYRNESERWEHVEWREMDQSVPFPETGAETHDVILNLPYLRIGGIGLHAISAHFWYDGFVPDEDTRVHSAPANEVPEWETVPEAMFGTPDWTYGAVEYFWIEQAP
jgi:hypothetical protein